MDDHIEHFHGVYEYTFDENNRLSIPSKFRKVMEHLKQKRFIISSLENTCLTLYPYQRFKERIADRLDELPQMDDDANELRRSIGMFTIEAKIDNQGRIFIPPEFCQRVGINKKVKIIGCVNKIEIWDPETEQKIALTRDAQSIKEELKKYRI